MAQSRDHAFDRSAVQMRIVLRIKGNAGYAAHRNSLSISNYSARDVDGTVLTRRQESTNYAPQSPVTLLLVRGGARSLLLCASAQVVFVKHDHVLIRRLHAA